MITLDPTTPWTLSHRFDPQAAEIADRHYSRRAVGSPQFVPPGRCLVLVADQSYWVTSWQEYVLHEWAGAWVCSAFRREGGTMRASDMIRHAVAHTLHRWPEPPDLGMITFVDAAKVRRKRDAGRCFRRAGFQPCGHTKGGLVALQLLPADMPDPSPPIGATFDLFR